MRFTSLAAIIAAWSALGAPALGQFFSNSSAITIPDIGTATPYPSTINVTGIGTITGSVRVKIFGYSHTFLGDVGIVLVSPAGGKVLLAGRCGDGFDATNATITFADGAPPLPTSDLPSGVYSPTNCTGGSNTTPFSPPGPASPYAGTLSSLIGTNADGSWALYVQDFLGGDHGAISGGWSIEFGDSFTYQGRVKNAGIPVNGALDLTFALFDQPTGGTQIGPTRARPATGVQDGVFSVVLNFGAMDDSPRFLEITVGGVTLVPRQLITLAPAAHFASRAGVAASAANADNATNASNALNATNAVNATNASNATNATVAQYALSASALDAPDGSPVNAVFVDNSGKVGIGTTTPQRLLHVMGGSAGTVTSSPAAMIVAENSATAYAQLVTPDTFESGVLFGSPTRPINGGIIFNNSGSPNGLQFRTNSNITRATLSAAGNLGIGTTAPARLVHVFGGSAGATPPDANSLLVVENSTHAYMQFLTPDASESGVFFGSPMNSLAGGIVYNNSTTPDGLQFRTNGNVIRAIISSAGNMGIGTANAGTFRLAVTGTCANTSGTWSTFSDQRLKRDLRPLEPGATLDRLLSLRGVGFEYTDDAVRTRDLPPGRRIGFVAQEVERVFPDWVSADDQGYKFITEQGTTALMVEALRDLRAEKDAALADKQAQIDDLHSRLDRLERLLEKKP